LTEEYRAEVDSVDAATWCRYVEEFRDGNLYQLWLNGHGGRFTDVSRLLLTKGGDVVAGAEVRLFKVPLTSRGIAYVRWGPLWQRGINGADPAHFTEALRALRNEYVRRRGMILRLAPRLFLEDHRQCADSLQGEGFLEVGARHVEKSLLMDVSPSLDELRRRLSPTWRRHLNKAEKNELTIETGTGIDLFDEFLPIYESTLRRKRFVTTSDVRRHRDVQALLPADLKMGIVLARHEDRPCAGAVYSATGDTALFVFGAANEVGLRLSASYLVHWEVLRQLKEKGFREYDLNGINPVLNPGVYQFKKGLVGKHGREVTFVGQRQAFEGSIANYSLLLAEWLRYRTRILTLRPRIPGGLPRLTAAATTSVQVSQ
jgi:hypothetical protein